MLHGGEDSCFILLAVGAAEEQLCWICLCQPLEVDIECILGAEEEVGELEVRIDDVVDDFITHALFRCVLEYVDVWFMVPDDPDQFFIAQFSQQSARVIVVTNVTAKHDTKHSSHQIESLDEFL